MLFSHWTGASAANQPHFTVTSLCCLSVSHSLVSSCSFFSVHFCQNLDKTCSLSITVTHVLASNACVLPCTGACPQLVLCHQSHCCTKTQTEKNIETWLWAYTMLFFFIAYGLMVSSAEAVTVGLFCASFRCLCPLWCQIHRCCVIVSVLC